MTSWGWTAALLAVIGFGLIGCNNDAATDDGSTPAAENGDAGADDGGSATTNEGDTSATGTEQDEIAEALASLSDEDRALAEKQKVCPVTDQPLGSMGPPKKISVKGQDVFICCGGCEEDLKSDPDKYLAKLSQ